MKHLKHFLWPDDWFKRSAMIFCYIVGGWTIVKGVIDLLAL